MDSTQSIKNIFLIFNPKTVTISNSVFKDILCGNFLEVRYGNYTVISSKFILITAVFWSSIVKTYTLAEGTFYSIKYIDSLFYNHKIYSSSYIFIEGKKNVVLERCSFLSLAMFGINSLIVYFDSSELVVSNSIFTNIRAETGAIITSFKLAKGYYSNSTFNNIKITSVGAVFQNQGGSLIFLFNCSIKSYTGNNNA